MNAYAKDLATRISEKVANISVIGLGYVGLNISLAFANNGFPVYGYDIDITKIKRLKKGENYISEEKNLDELLPQVLGKNFFPSSDVEEASQKGDVIIIIVPTADGDVPTISYLEKALESVRKNDIRGKLIVIESTVMVGTTENFVRSQLEKDGLEAGTDFFIAYSPERIDPGNAQMTFTRIPKVVGGIDDGSSDLGEILYKQVIEKVIRVSNARTAELVKLMENTQRDMNIALINLFAMMCEECEIDVEEAISAAATKWNFHRYRPSCGVGGHCLKKDPILLAQSFQGTELDMSLIFSSRRINDMMPLMTAEKALSISHHVLNKRLEDVRIGVLGLSYKKNSSDIRNSPAFSIISHIRESGVKKVYMYDPLTNVEPQCEKAELQNCDIIIQTVAHEGFDQILGTFNGYIIDGTNTLEPSDRVFGVGRVLENLRALSIEDVHKNCPNLEKDPIAELKGQ